MSATGVNERLAALTAAGTSIWLDQLSRGLLESGELARMVEQSQAGGRPFQRPGAADHDRTEPLFQLTDMLADGRLRDVKRGGGAGEAAMFGERCGAADPERIQHNKFL